MTLLVPQGLDPEKQRGLGVSLWGGIAEVSAAEKTPHFSLSESIPHRLLLDLRPTVPHIIQDLLFRNQTPKTCQRSKHKRQCVIRQPRKHVIYAGRERSRSAVSPWYTSCLNLTHLCQCKILEDGTTCEACQELGLKCTRDKPRRKRGPPSRCVDRPIHYSLWHQTNDRFEVILKHNRHQCGRMWSP